MRNAYKRLSPVVFLSFFASIAAFAQTPPPGGQPTIPKPQNLKILPKDIAVSDLLTIMRGYNAQLGVQCGFCHAGQGRKLDFASDSKPDKAAARIMMTMTQEINAKYVSTIPDYMGGKVTCGTCHRGHSMPEVFTPPAGAAKP